MKVISKYTCDWAFKKMEFDNAVDFLIWASLQEIEQGIHQKLTEDRINGWYRDFERSL